MKKELAAKIADARGVLQSARATLMDKARVLTTGTILQVDVTASVEYGAGKTATFVDQLMAGGMSAGGDSGSAILNERNEIVGLLFAGSANTTIINRIDNVFSLLQLSLPQ